MSTDPHPTQTACAASLGGLPFPLLSDFHPKGEASRAYGLYNEELGTSDQAIIIVDKRGVVRYRQVYAEVSDIVIEDFLAVIDRL